MGQVYWITGLSGAGKTTIGKFFMKTAQKICKYGFFRWGYA